MSGRFLASEIFAEGFSGLMREKEVFFLLGSLLAILNLFYMWPFLDFYIESIELFLAGPEGMAQIESHPLFKEEMTYYLYTFLPYLVVMLIPMAIWVRVVMSGKTSVFEGGAKRFLNRFLWVLWRYICLFGWLILIVGGTAFALIFLTTSLGVALGKGGVGVTIFLVILLYGFIFYVTAVLMVLFYLSLSGEMHDVRLPIHKSFNLMKGNLARAGGFMILTFLVFMVGYSLVFGMMVDMFKDTPSGIMMVALFVLFLASSLFNFLLVSFGAGYAIRLVPELR